MKTFIVNVFTFLGVVAVIVAIRSAPELDNLMADWHQDVAYQGSSDDDVVGQDKLNESIEEAERWAKENIKLSPACDKYSRCTDREIDLIMHLMADASQVLVDIDQGGFVFNAIYYQSDSNIFVYEMTFDPEVSMADVPEDLLDATMREVGQDLIADVCSDPEVKKGLNMGVDVGYWLLDQYGWEHSFRVGASDCT